MNKNQLDFIIQLLGSSMFAGGGAGTSADQTADTLPPPATVGNTPTTAPELPPGTGGPVSLPAGSPNTLNPVSVFNPNANAPVNTSPYPGPSGIPSNPFGANPAGGADPMGAFTDVPNPYSDIVTQLLYGQSPTDQTPSTVATGAYDPGSVNLNVANLGLPNDNLPTPPGVTPDAAAAQPIDAPGGDIANIMDVAPPTADIRSPTDSTFPVSNVNAPGTPGTIDPTTGLPIPGTALSPTDQAANFNLQQFPGGNFLTDAAGNLVDTAGNIIQTAGNFFKDASGNFIDAAGNIIQGASNFLQNAGQNIGNVFNQIGYQPPPGTTEGETGPLNEGVIASLGPGGGTLPPGLFEGLGNPLTTPGGTNAASFLGADGGNLGNFGNVYGNEILQHLMKFGALPLNAFGQPAGTWTPESADFWSNIWNQRGYIYPPSQGGPDSKGGQPGGGGRNIGTPPPGPV